MTRLLDSSKSLTEQSVELSRRAGHALSQITDTVWRQVAGGALVVFGVLILAALIRYLLRELLRAAGLGATDRFFGALFGIVRGLAFAFVVVLIGGLAGVSREPWWTQALFSPPMESAVIAAKPWLPAEVADKIRFR